MKPSSLNCLIWDALVAAIVVVGVATGRLWKNKDEGLWKMLKSRMGQPKWDFTQSWASIFTGAGVIATSILSAQVVGAPSTASYAAISIMFGALVVMAPLVYNFVRTSQEVPGECGKKAYQYQGYVGVFLIASAITVWGASGQIVVIGFLLEELRGSHFVSYAVARLFQCLLAAVELALLISAGRTIYWTVEQQMVHWSERLRTFAAGSTARPRLPDWPLL
jgi:hypothetical protein